MFNNKRILTLEAESKELRAHIIEMRNQIEGILSALAETQKSFKDCSLVVSSEFPLIKKEITLLLIDSLAKNTKDGDFLRLKTELTRPVLEAKWKKAELEKGKQADENIKTLGQDIVAMRKQIHDEMLVKERQGKDITELKGKMEILNLIIGDEL